MLKNTVALVTGAVSGLGRQTLTHFLKENAQVFGCDIKDDRGELEKNYGDDVGFLKADVRNEKDMEEVLHRAKQKFGHVDILVNCAGFSSAFLTVTSRGVPFTLDTFSRLIDVNVCGQFNASRLTAKAMAENKPDEDGNRGVIILTSGFASRTARKGHVAIGASYGAIESMTLPMSRDLSSLGIRVVTISPGLFATPLTGSLSEPVQQFLFKCQSFPHRFGNPTEYSDVALHIVQNKMLNGEVVSIDGGLVLPTI